MLACTTLLIGQKPHTGGPIVCHSQCRSEDAEKQKLRKVTRPLINSE